MKLIIKTNLVNNTRLYIRKASILKTIIYCCVIHLLR